MLAIDTETTGLDSFHGCKTFFVSTCDEDGEQLWFEWDVDPLTRDPIIPQEDVDEISVNLGSMMADEVLGHNTKFDIAMLRTIGIDDWPWDNTHDTIMAAHLLASNQPKNLTDLVLIFLGEDIQPYEIALEEAVRDARRKVQHAKLQDKRGKHDNPLAAWRIAEEGDPMLPSAGNEIWRSDYWLPRALAKHLGLPEDHPWWTVLSEYANQDTAVLPPLWRVMRAELERRDLWELYVEKNRNTRVLSEMERRGTTIHRTALGNVRAEYEQDIEECNTACIEIADVYQHELTLPKSGMNKSLTSFVFDVLKLSVVKRTKKGSPSFDKEVIEEYKKTLQDRPLQFIHSLSSARKRQKSCEFFDAYETFGIPSPRDVLLLHPSVNPTATATTRLSMSNPNLQQVSRQDSVCEECHGDGCVKCAGTGEDLHSVRKVFGPAEDREWWSMDARNIELRLPAYESGEPSLIDLFEKSNEPPFYGSQHMLNMSIVYDDIWNAEMKAVGIKNVAAHCKKKYTPGPYHSSKCGGLAMQYQCGEETADRAFRREGGYRKLKSYLSKLNALNDKYVGFANRHGYVETLLDKSIGAKRGYPLECSRTEYGRILPTVPLNYHVQGCLQGGSLVTTSNGLVAIKDLVGKSVSVWTGFNWANAVGLSRGACSLANVHLSSGHVIKCDIRHKFKNEHDKWIDFKDLKAGDYVALPKNTTPLSASQNINWWFLFGFIIGDGCLTVRGNRKMLCITGGKLKKSIIDGIKNFLVNQGYSDGGLRGVHCRLIRATDTRAEKYAISLENVEFSRMLEEFGFSFEWKSGTKRIPSSVWTATQQHQRDFLEGLWLSDGTRNSTAGAGKRLNMTNPELLAEVQILASSLGFDARFTGTQLSFSWKAFNAKSPRKYPASAITRQVSSVLKRGEYLNTNQHAIHVRAFKDAKAGKPVSQYVAERLLEINNPNSVLYRYDTVVRIELLDTVDETYTMSVDDPLHQFVADGVISKNTAGWWMVRAMNRCHDQLSEWRKTGFDGYICLTVHDELVFDFPRKADPMKNPKASNLSRARKLQSLMQTGGDDIGIPTPVSIEFHTHNWSEGIAF